MVKEVVAVDHKIEGRLVPTITTETAPISSTILNQVELVEIMEMVVLDKDTAIKVVQVVETVEIVETRPIVHQSTLEAIHHKEILEIVVHQVDPGDHQVAMQVMDKEDLLVMQSSNPTEIPSVSVDRPQIMLKVNWTPDALQELQKRL